MGQGAREPRRDDSEARPHQHPLEEGASQLPGIQGTHVLVKLLRGSVKCLLNE